MIELDELSGLSSLNDPTDGINSKEKKYIFLAADRYNSILLLKTKKRKKSNIQRQLCAKFHPDAI